MIVQIVYNNHVLFAENIHIFEKNICKATGCRAYGCVHDADLLMIVNNDHDNPVLFEENFQILGTIYVMLLVVDLMDVSVIQKNIEDLFANTDHENHVLFAENVQIHDKMYVVLLVVELTEVSMMQTHY